jgi:hypothetical protein
MVKQSKYVKVTRRQREAARLCIEHPELSGAEICRRAGLGKWSQRVPKVALEAPGVQIAKAELQSTYRAKLAEKVSIDRATDRISQLIDSEDGSTALKALNVALEGMGIIEPRDQQTVVTLVVNQMIGVVAPYVAEDRRGELLRDLEGMDGRHINQA